MIDTKRYFDLSMKCIGKPGPRTSEEMHGIYIKIRELVNDYEDEFFDLLDAELARLTGSDDYYAVGIDDFTDDELEQIYEINDGFVKKNISREDFESKMPDCSKMPFVFDLYGSTYDSYESYSDIICDDYTFWVIVRKDNPSSRKTDHTVAYISFVDEKYKDYGYVHEERISKPNDNNGISISINTDPGLIDEEEFHAWFSEYIKGHMDFIWIVQNFKMLMTMIGGIVKSHEKWSEIGLISDYDFMSMSQPLLEYTALKAVGVLAMIPPACSEEIRKSIGGSFTVVSRLFKKGFDIVVGKGDDVMFDVEFEKGGKIEVGISDACPVFKKKRIESMV